MNTTIRNVDNCPYSVKNGTYGGMSGLKDGIVIDGEDWLVKFPKNAKNLRRHQEMEYTNDPVSEYLASHIYALLGYPVHETMLVERRGKIAVACKDFCTDGKILLEIRTIKNSANAELAEKLERSFNSTGSTHSVNLDEILLHIQYNDLLKNIPGIEERFWDMLIVDIFTNNSDRNNGNWGIIRQKGSCDELAPIFDNGGAFNGKTPDSRLLKMLNNNDTLLGNINGGQTTFCDNNEKQILAKEILRYNTVGLKNAITKNVPLIRSKMSEIKDLIESVPEQACSRIRKDFYIKSLELRLEVLLEPAFEQLMNHEKSQSEHQKVMTLDERIAEAKRMYEQNKERKTENVENALSRMDGWIDPSDD